MRRNYYQATTVKNKTKNKIIFFSILLFSGLILYLIFTQLKIKQIEVKTGQFIDKNRIEQIVWNNIDNKLFQSNLIFLSKNTIIDDVKKEFSFELIDINKRLFNKIEIKIIEHSPSAFWATNGEAYEPIEEAEGEIKSINRQNPIPSKLMMVDNRGVIIQEWNKPEIEASEEGELIVDLLDQPKIFAQKNNQNLPLIVDMDGRGSAAGEKVISDNFLTNIQKIQQEFNSDTFPFSIKYFAFPSSLSPKEARIMTNEGFWLIISLDNNLSKVSKNLQEIITKNKIIDLNKLQYIDLRLSDRVFYK